MRLKSLFSILLCMACMMFVSCSDGILSNDQLEASGDQTEIEVYTRSGTGGTPMLDDEAAPAISNIEVYTSGGGGGLVAPGTREAGFTEADEEYSKGGTAGTPMTDGNDNPGFTEDEVYSKGGTGSMIGGDDKPGFTEEDEHYSKGGTGGTP